MLLTDLFKLWYGAGRTLLAHETGQHEPGLPFRRFIDDPEDDALSRLTVEDGGTVRRCKDERDDRKILLAVDEEHSRRTPDQIGDRARELIGDRPGGVLRRQPPSRPEQGQAGAGQAHRIAVDDGDVRDDPGVEEVMGHHIADGVDRPARKPGEKFADTSIKGAERLFEEIPVRFGEPEHQRTFSAYRPGRVIFIFFAISECSGSMMTT